MIEVKIICFKTGETFWKASDTDQALDVDEIAKNFMACLVEIEGSLLRRDKVPIDVPLLVVSKLLEISGLHLDLLSKSLNGARTKRQRELARVCVVLSEELATESNRHEG